jgi:predicted metal-dependent enzyme (double-stranded beta helix superfamily)
MTVTAFGEFVEQVNDELQASAEPGRAPRAVRNQLRAALSRTDFAVDCVELVLDTMESMAGRWRSPPIYDDEQHQYAIRLFYWPPGFENSAHRHEDWTVTGVMHNALLFRTYNDVNGALIEDKRIDCRAGDVGYIDTPCIHNVANKSERESISIHIFSGAKITFTDSAGELETRRGRSAWHRPSAAQAEGAPDQLGGADFERARQRALSTFTSLLSGTADPRRGALLERAFALGSLPVKLAVVKALAVADTARAAVKAHELAALCSADVGRELSRIGERLARTAHAS